MKIELLRSIALFISVTLMGGCFAYVPPSTSYSSPASYPVYGGYNYGIYQLPQPVFIGHGWGNRRYGYYRHH